MAPRFVFAPLFPTPGDLIADPKLGSLEVIHIYPSGSLLCRDLRCALWMLGRREGLWSLVPDTVILEAYPCD
jgi:hypothetical protein